MEGLSSLSSTSSNAFQQDLAETASELTTAYGGTVTETHDNLQMFTVNNLTETQARQMSHDPSVLSVTADYPGEADSFTYQNLEGSFMWGLDQIDWPTNGAIGTFGYQRTGEGTHVYVFDSGIRTTHSEFEGRATADFNATSITNAGTDEVNHGTAMASIVAGKTYGVAKKARIHSIKIMYWNGALRPDNTRQGVAYVSAVVKGINWLMSHRQNPAIALMCFHLNTYKTILLQNSTSALDTAARKLANSGVTVVCSAGNNNVEARKVSPANVQELIVVGAVDQNLRRSRY